MRHLIPALSILLFFTACNNQEAVKRAQESAQIAKALKAHEQVRLDFVPFVNDGEQDKMALPVYRQELRVKKGGLIDSLSRVSQMGSPGEQVAVGAMLADAHSSSARYIADETMRQWSDLTERSTLLVTHLSKIGQVNSNLQLFNRNESDLLAKLRDQRTTFEAQLDRNGSVVDQISERVSKEQESLESHDRERQMKEAEASVLAERIKQASGSDLLDLQAKAAEARLGAARAESRKKRQILKIELLESKLRVTTREAELSQQVTDAVTGQIVQVTTRQKLMAEAHAEQQKARGTLFSELADQFKSVTAMYNEKVHKPLTDALDHATKAIDIAERAARKAPRDSRESRRRARLNLVAMKVSKAHIQTQQIITLASYGHTLTSVADGVEDVLKHAHAADRDQYASDVYRNQANEITEQHEALVAEAKQLLAEGAEESKEMAEGPEGDPVTDAAASHQMLFAAYLKRIDRTMGVEASSIAPPPRSARTDGLTPAAAGLEKTTGASITGELPPLPIGATAGDASVLVWLDGRLLTPKVLQDTARLLLGENTGMVNDPLNVFATHYGQFASAGGTSVLLSIRMPQEEAEAPPAPIVFVSLKQGVDQTAMASLFDRLNQTQHGPAMKTQRHGDWFVIQPADTAPASAGTPQRQALFEQIFEATGDAPVRYAVVPDKQMLVQLREHLAAAPVAGADEGNAVGLNPMAAQVLDQIEDVQWAAVSLRLADQFGFYTTVEYVDDSSAAAAVEQLNDQLDRLQSGLDTAGPLAMFAPMIRSALQVTQDGQRVQVDVAGQSLRQLVAMAVPMVQQMMGGGTSPGDMDFGPGEPPDADDQDTSDRPDGDGEPHYTK